MIRIVAYGSPEYDATVELRRAVLRRPLGLDFTPEQLVVEATDIHLALFEPLEPLSPSRERGRGEAADGACLACLILTSKDPTTLKMRQVAVRSDQQGKGLGRRLVEASEAWARERGYARMVLHARETAVPFYLALSYSVEGEPFEEVDIPHRAMFKVL